MDINYIELPALDFAKMKHFYGEAFGWEFKDFGVDYVSFSNAGLEGGFVKIYETPPRGGALVILLTDNLTQTDHAIRELGGEIVAYYDFPGGQRFHFLDPTGNELAVWFKSDDAQTTE